MDAFRRILVAVDGSENSLAACSAAGRLSTAPGARIDVVRVVPQSEGGRDRGEARKMLNRACAMVSGGVRIKRRVIEARGSPVEALVNYAADRECDLIVVGAKGSGGFRRLLLGSVASGVVTHAHVPVLVVRSLSSFTGKLFQHVLVAVDGSEPSRVAVRMAARLAGSLGARLTMLHVISIPAAAYSSGSSVATQMEKKARSSAEGYLAAAKESAEDSGVDAKARITEDLRSPVKGITEYAARNHVDLIVMGTRGLGGFKRLLLGSVAGGVVSYADCSVMVVRGV